MTPLEPKPHEERVLVLTPTGADASVADVLHVRLV